MFAALRHRLPRLGWFPRLCAVGICLLLALSSALGRRGNLPVRHSVPVLVAARDLPAGHTLRGADVRIARWPPELRPSAARASPAGLLGRRLIAPISARAAVTSNQLLGPGLTAGLSTGLAAASVSVDDPHLVEFVHAGVHVDLLATARPPDGLDPPAARSPVVTTVARTVLVLATFAGTDGASSEVVLAVDRATAVAIVRDRATQVFTVVTDPP
jgi:pilus assembly protein CpaB